MKKILLIVFVYALTFLSQKCDAEQTLDYKVSSPFVQDDEEFYLELVNPEKFSASINYRVRPVVTYGSVWIFNPEVGQFVSGFEKWTTLPAPDPKLRLRVAGVNNFTSRLRLSILNQNTREFSNTNELILVGKGNNEKYIDLLNTSLLSYRDIFNEDAGPPSAQIFEDPIVYEDFPVAKKWAVAIPVLFVILFVLVGLSYRMIKYTGDSNKKMDAGGSGNDSDLFTILDPGKNHKFNRLR